MTLFLVPAIVATYAFNCILLISVFPDAFPDYLTKLWFFIALIMGIVFGVAMSSNPRSGILFMGTSIGIVLGFIVYYCFIIVINADGDDLTYEFSSKNLWVTSITCVFICASASIIFFDHAMIVSSAIYGAYIFVKVSLLSNLNFCIIGAGHILWWVPERVRHHARIQKSLI